MDNNEELNIELSRDNIYGYIFTTQNYSEDADDRRKKPLFFWKGFHMYPIVVKDPSQLEDVDDDEDISPDDVDLLICTEGGTPEQFNFVPMTVADLIQFLRQNPSFRMWQAEDFFDELNIA